MDRLPDHLLLACAARLSVVDLAILRCVCRRLRQLLSDACSLFDYRARHGCLQPWLCVLGGIQEDKGDLLAEMYDFTRCKWMPLPVLPPSSFFNFSCVLVDCRMYAVGGFMGLLSDVASKMSVYDTRSNCWEEVPRMTELREACACGVIRGCIYVAGGYCRLNNVSGLQQQRVSSGEMYVPCRKQWQPIANMKNGRSCCVSAVVGEKLYVIGGHGWDSILSTVEVYDPIADEWENKSSMPVSWIVGGCAVIGYNIYVVGSDVLNMDEQALAVYDTRRDVWEVAGHIPLHSLVRGSKCSLWGCSVVGHEGNLYVVGGASSFDGGGLNTVLVYNPVTGMWSTSAPMRCRRYGCAAVVLNL